MPAAAAELTDAGRNRRASGAVEADLGRQDGWRSPLLAVMLAVLTLVFFFQGLATRNARAFFWFRMGFLTVTLVFLGWYANAQLSVVNLMALFGALVIRVQLAGLPSGPPDLHPVVLGRRGAALLGPGRLLRLALPLRRAAGAHQPIARALHIPQWTLPWGLHERLWPVKYMIFLGLFGVSLMSIEQAEHLAEVEPFKTAIVLKFVRAWPFVALCAGAAGRRALRRALLLPLPLPAGRGARDPGAATDVRLAQALPATAAIPARPAPISAPSRRSTRPARSTRTNA